jgi:hypothetical protein
MSDKEGVEEKVQFLIRTNYVLLSTSQVTVK